MATSKSTALTNAQLKPQIIRGSRLDRGREVTALDSIAQTTAAAADVMLFKTDIPSNSIVTGIWIRNDDMDSGCAPALTIDVGLYASQPFKSKTSSVVSSHAEDELLDIDAFVDNSTVLQAATTSFTSQAFDATTFGPDDALKPCWEVLGYDEDPKTEFRVAITVATGAQSAAAGDVVLMVKYLVDG